MGYIRICALPSFEACVHGWLKVNLTFQRVLLKAVPRITSIIPNKEGIECRRTQYALHFRGMLSAHAGPGPRRGGAHPPTAHPGRP